MFHALSTIWDYKQYAQKDIDSQFLRSLEGNK